MTIFGYGKMLDIDLGTGTTKEKPIEAAFAKSYIGGMGFGCKLLFDEVRPGADPFGPENVLIFANGPLTGTAAPSSGRTEVTTVSPLTGRIGTGNTGGLWGARLKRCGVDLLLVRSISPEPVYIWIDDGAVELRSARHLWGKDTEETTDAIYGELADRNLSVLAIGPAGENLVRYACPVNDLHHCVARAGAGAVMGAKRLKAIAVRGSGTPNIARPGAFKEAVKEARERLKESTLKRSRQYGNVTKNVIRDYQERGAWPHKNFQYGTVPEPWVSEVDRNAAMRHYVKEEGTCHACPISCFNLMEVKQGKYKGVRVTRGSHPGVVVEWAGKCAIDNLPAVWKCKETCQKLGMDYVSASGTIAFAMELFQRKIIGTDDTDGLELTWGNEDVVTRLLEDIALRKGFGDILADGCDGAAGRIGRGSDKYAMTIKGMEKMSSDPRSGSKGWVFGDLTNPRGGDNVKNTHFLADFYDPGWWVDEFDIPEEIKKQIYSVPPDKISVTWDGKPLMCIWFENLYSILNALGLCFFPSGFNLAIGPSHLSKLFSACTGLDTTPAEIMKMGERIFTLLKANTVREGLGRQHDTWPDRFFDEPIPDGPAKGTVLSRDTIDQLLDEYYALRGWDKTLGIPTERKLMELGLGDIAIELKNMGRIGPLS